ncbi:complex I subunit 5 family protein [Kocuria sp. NPDC057446]|uniref:complex I subunit 5 family protein n=1 Tax=Kocuria sp. NPDC057446 TaxID=3346137 RepID=UPI00369DDED7
MTAGGFTFTGPSVVPLVMVLVSLVPGAVIFFLREDQVRARSTLNIAAAVAKLALVAALVPVVVAGARPEWRTPLFPGIDLVLRAEPLSLLFAGLSAVLWLLTTVYAIGYLERYSHRSRFFGFFSLCVAATVGISFSGNLVTFLIFFELLTITTYPLVAHWGTAEAVRAARLYLFYTLSGGLSLLAGVALLTVHAGSVDFGEGGAAGVRAFAAEDPAAAALAFVLMVAGLGVKAALFPLHGWLPRAMVAPAPVSALLHAVAVVKAGVFGIVRVVDDVYGVELAHDLGVLGPLLALAAFTVVYGSVLALRQQDLKRRLAYSTVSQVSYVTMGIAMFSEAATAGGLVHLVHQGLMKITLFFCAGIFAEVLGVKTVSGLAGVGRRMPLTAAAFTVGAFGMIGLPPVAGFVSKWQLGQGALDAGHPEIVGVLLLSALLNAAYFLPAVYALWFREPPEGAADDGVPPARDRGGPLREAPGALLVPVVTTAVLSVAAGVLAGVAYSPLWLSLLIAEGAYPG